MGFIKNFIGFQIGWFACVVGAAQGYPLVAVAVAAIIVILHLLRDNNIYFELCLIVSAVFVGIIWESLLLASNWLSYSSSDNDTFFAPVWLVAMWALFATTINHSMAWLKGRYFLAMILGAIFGPLAFIAGENLDAVVFVDRTMALAALALGWSALMPFLLWLAERFKQRNNIMEF